MLASNIGGPNMLWRLNTVLNFVAVVVIVVSIAKKIKKPPNAAPKLIRVHHSHVLPKGLPLL